MGQRRFGEPVGGEVSRQRVRPFVTENRDRLRRTEVPVEENPEPFLPPKALAHDRFGDDPPPFTRRTSERHSGVVFIVRRPAAPPG